MISRLIILVFLSITIQTIVAQDLDPVILPAKDQTKEATSLPPASETPKSVDVKEASPTEIEPAAEGVSSDEQEVFFTNEAPKNIERDPNTYRKEEYLNKLLRQTYYQRLTTTQWSKYLNHNGWKKSVEKWRYWNQLKNYITGNDQDILVIRTPNVESTKPTETEAEPTEIIDSNQIEIAEVAPPQLDTETVANSPILSAITPEIEDTTQVVAEEEKSTVPEIALTKVTDAPWLKEIIKTEVDTLLIAEISAAQDTLAKIEEPKEEIVEVTNDIEEIVEPSSTISSNNELQPTYTEPIVEEPKEITNTEVVATTQPVVEQSIPIKSQTIETTTSYNSSKAAEDFNQLQGNVPWPVNGRITDRFGIRQNAEARGLRPENYGIDMICPTGTIVKAVHSGTVIMSRRQSPYDYIVSIKHGEFTSHYYYLITPYVKIGDVVQTGQSIGQLRTSVEEADFHFEIWNNQERVNPELWLNRR